MLQIVATIVLLAWLLAADATTFLNQGIKGVPQRGKLDKLKRVLDDWNNSSTCNKFDNINQDVETNTCPEVNLKGVEEVALKNTVDDTGTKSQTDDEVGPSPTLNSEPTIDTTGKEVGPQDQLRNNTDLIDANSTNKNVSIENLEEAVVEVTSENFQKLVLDSPVPVLVDIYADWCGPCKQLAPILEAIARDNKDRVRLAKINGEKEPRITQLFNLKGYPSVFTFSGGVIQDGFVGIPPQEELEKYLWRAIFDGDQSVQMLNRETNTSIGMGDSQKSSYATLSQSVQQFAGMAAISAKQRELVFSAVDRLIEGSASEVFAPPSPASSITTSATANTAGEMSDGVKAVVHILQKCIQDIRDPSVRTLSATEDSAYARTMRPVAAADTLLRLAGFLHKNVTEANGEDKPVLQLRHTNVAILSLILQRLDEAVNERRFAKLPFRPPPSNSRRRGGSSGAIVHATAGKPTAATSPTLLPAGPKPSSPAKSKVADSANRVKNSPQLDHVMLSGKESRGALEKVTKGIMKDVFAYKQTKTEKVRKQGANPLERNSVKSLKSLSQKRSGVHTLFSSQQEPKKKYNEYFGGDSTVVSAGPDEATTKSPPASEEKPSAKPTKGSLKVFRKGNPKNKSLRKQ